MPFGKVRMLIEISDDLSPNDIILGIDFANEISWMLSIMEFEASCGLFSRFAFGGVLNVILGNSQRMGIGFLDERP